MSELNEIMDPYEDSPLIPARELFFQLGYEPPPPEAVDDSQLAGRLWEFIYALAGKRFYIYHSDHLSDRELYVWLHEYWLPSEVRDVPYSAGWNCMVAPGISEPAKAEEIYLRYYADAEERARWAADFPGCSMPASEKPPHDRDRWLPDPPDPAYDFSEEALAIMEEESAIAMSDEESDPEEDLDFSGGLNEPDESDPLGLARVDREIQAQKEAATQELDTDSDPDLEDDEEDEEEAWAGLDETWERPRDVLQRAGVRLLPPAELTDESLAAHLWELLHNLACRGYYVQHSNHLCDRELYEEIWERGLTDLSLLPGKSKTGGWFHDVIGSYGPEDMQLWLRYYASDAERAEHLRQNPDEPLPPKELPAATRDWRLPKGPF